MKNLWAALRMLHRTFALSPERAEHLAQIKFPCC